MMLVIRGIVLLHLVSFCIAANTTKNISLKTGNKLAVLRFEGSGVSDPLIEHITEELRQSIRELKTYRVQNYDVTSDVSIFYPTGKDYWACWSEECAVVIGKQLKVNYVVAGNIQKEDGDFIINGRLFSVDMETMVNEFALNSSGITDSLLLEMKKMAYNVSGLPVPDTLLSVESDTSQVDITENIERKRLINFPQLPQIPTKIKALMMSTAIPGSGQIWVQKTYPGYGFMGTEATLGLFSLIAYYQYNKAWKGFDKNYSNYQDETDPHILIELRPKIIQYAEDTKRYNSFMKNIRGVAGSIWVVNMLHAYLVAPADDYFDGESFFDIEYRPDINQIQFNINF